MAGRVGGVTLDAPLASQAEILIAQNEGAMEQTVEAIQRDAESPANFQGGTTTHNRPRRVYLWKKTDYGWRPRLVPSSNLRTMLNEGWKPVCGDCNSPLCGVPGGTDVNKCTGRESLMFRRCPECGKKVFDAPKVNNRAIEAEADESEITDDDFDPSTPEKRTRTRLEIHIATFHPAEAANYNVRVAFGDQPRIEPKVVSP